MGYMLEIQDVHKTFNAGTINEKVALNGVNLNLNPGDFVTIIGGNGAGKSTTLNAIAGVWSIDAGKIVIDGVDITKLSEHKRAAFLGRVFQDPMTGTAATMSIEENMAIAARRGQRRGLGWGITKKENQNLRLAKENLCKEKEKAELERDKKTLETANLKLEIAQLESERDNLIEYKREQSELSKPIYDVINARLDMLNSLLAKEITNNDTYAKPYVKWIESIHQDKKKFMDSTRLAFTASHPKFISYLEQHRITTDEINYLCLYAIGLRGKEVGEYIQVKRHYNISSEIRKKLGIDEHETNIGLYIRRLLKDL